MERRVITKSFGTGNELTKYAASLSLRLTDEQKELIDITLKHPRCMMLGAPEALQLASNLIKNKGAKKILDIGVYTGASALSAALATGEDGKVYALDINDEYASIGKPIWKKAGVEHKIELIIGPAVETLQKFIAEGQSGTFDFAFIDADKNNYMNYYEMCLTLLRPGGIIAIDNTLWSGAVLDESDQTLDTRCIREINEKLKDDERIDVSLLTVGDGLTLCFKK